MAPAALRLDPPAQPPRLGWFVLASLALHALLLATWAVERPVEFGDTQGKTASITLEAVLARPQPLAQNKTAKTISRPRHQERHAPYVKQARQWATTHPVTSPGRLVAKADPRPEPKPETAAAARPRTPPAVGAAHRRHLLGRIRLALADHFHYPLQARRLGWQGTVLLGFHLTPHGQIEAIRVEHSSGYDILDAAAVTALGEVQQLPPEQPTVVSALDLTLPVIYRIEER